MNLKLYDFSKIWIEIILLRTKLKKMLSFQGVIHFCARDNVKRYEFTYVEIVLATEMNMYSLNIYKKLLVLHHLIL